MQNNTQDLQNNNPQDDDEISLLDLLIVPAKHKRLLIGLPLLLGALALAYGLIAKPVFEAQTTILPPQKQQSSAAAMLSQLGGLAGAAGASLGIKNPNDLYVAMLESRSIADQLISKFKLQEVYEAEMLTNARLRLAASSKISSGKDGLITIAVEDHSPELAAKLANAYVEELRNLTKTLAVTEAGERRQYFENQLNKTKKELADAEIALKQTQEKTGVLQLEVQGQATMEALAALRAQIASRQVQLSAMRNFATEQNPDYQRVRAELSGLQQQLNVLTKGSSDDVLISKAKAPEIAVEYMRKVRDLKYQETLFELLSKQYELAKLDEARDGANIQILDVATPPERKSSPKRAKLILIAGMAGFFLACIGAFVLEGIKNSKADPEGSRRWDALVGAWKGR